MLPPFSARTRWDLSDNALTRALASLRGRGIRWDDLTESNPTKVGLGPNADLLAELGHPRGSAYEPEPFGHREARQAIADSYAERGHTVDTSRIVVTASTSEAYGWLFKLLCDRDDEVLIPQPSYPLLSYLSALEDVRLAPYPLLREERFRPDLGAIEAAIGPRTRAIVMVHPNNPTGTFIREDDAADLERLAERHGLALVVDEVFVDYPLGERPPRAVPSFVTRKRALTFVLNGLSKVLAMPQVKLGWMVLAGPDEVVSTARERLEVIADTYLSVATPIQRALPSLLAARSTIQAPILRRTQDNLQALDAALAIEGLPVRRLPTEGGWYAILEIPRTRTEDEWALRLLEEDHLLVHPGWFFDLDREGYLVVSLLPEAPRFAAAVERMLRRLTSG